MGFKFDDYVENFQGPVKVKVIDVESGTTGKGSEFVRLNLEVIGIMKGYKEDEYKDPTGYVCSATLWTPMESDRGTFNDKGKEKYPTKAKMVGKIAMAFGFEDEFPDSDESWTGLEAGCTLQIGENGDPEPGIFSFKPLVG